MRVNRISAKVVADSKNQQGDRITTMEVVFPRFILAEMNTHRMFSRNSASSRAIPFKKMKRSVKENLFIPMAFQKDHKGMQGTKYFEGWQDTVRVLAWKLGAKMAILSSTILFKLGVTKQLANRLLEPFMYHKVLITATEFENFFNLRSPQYKVFGDNKNLYKTKRSAECEYGLSDYNELDWLKINQGMGEIHIMDLAEKMFNALTDSTPKQLEGGQWHVPYGDDLIQNDDFLKYFLSTVEGNWKDDEEFDKLMQLVANKISTARCARLSYQTLGDNPVIDYAKDLSLYKTLEESGHFSPFEHVSQCMTAKQYSTFYKHDTRGVAYGWCLNFKGFIQQRFFLEKVK